VLESMNADLVSRDSCIGTPTDNIGKFLHDLSRPEELARNYADSAISILESASAANPDSIEQVSPIVRIPCSRIS